MPSLAHLCILLSGFFCEVGVGGRGVMGGDHLNFQMGTRPEKTLGRSLDLPVKVERCYLIRLSSVSSITEI